MSRLAIVFASTRENPKSPSAPCGSAHGLLNAANSRRFDTGDRHDREPSQRYHAAYKLVVRMSDAWNAHDLEGYINGFWNSPDLVVIVKANK